MMSEQDWYCINRLWRVLTPQHHSRHYTDSLPQRQPSANPLLKWTLEVKVSWKIKLTVLYASLPGLLTELDMTISHGPSTAKVLFLKK